MKSMRKRLMAMLLCVVMCVSLLPVPALAEGTIAAADESTISRDGDRGTIEETVSVPEEFENQENTEKGEVTLHEVYVNPLYADVITEEDLVAPEEGAKGQMSRAVYSSMEEAGTYVRECMVNREGTVSFTVSFDVTSPSFDDTNSGIMDAAFAHTGNPKEGDSIRFQYGGWHAEAKGSGGNWTITYTITYYTSASQEQEMDQAVENVLRSLQLDGKTEYETICAVYDYITENITYDYDNLNVESYKLKYTAYAALINKTAVCQGYAVLLYRMLLESGIDCRVISGIGNGGNHAWNIIRIGSLYYDVDSTWDAVRDPYEYYLRCDANFDNHTRGEDYSTDAFYEAYPMSNKDYDPNEIIDDPDGIIASGTCGDNLNWVLTDDGVLTISGTGDMWDVSYDSVSPWDNYKENIISVMIENGATSIGMSAFQSCTALTSVTLPESMTKIGMFAFQSCTSLADVTIPASVTNLSATAFRECTSFAGFTVDAGNTSYTAVDGVLFSKDETTIICYPAGKDEPDYVIPEGVTTVGQYAFTWCNSLMSVTIPTGVTSIAGQTFTGCTSLTSVLIPDSVTTIGFAAFADCTALESITIPDSVTSFGGQTFTRCTSLESIIFEGSVPTIYSNDFTDVTATAYYPADDPTWTEEVMQDYGGDITWVAGTPGNEEPFEDYTDLVLNQEATVTIGSGNTVYFRFVPEETKKYSFYSSSDTDTRGYLYDSDGFELTEDDDGGKDYNFNITYTLNAGETYYYGVCFYDKDLIRSFPVVLKAVKELEITSITAEDVTVYEGLDGYWSTDYYWDEELQKDVEVKYFYFDSIEPEITIETADGNTFSGNLDKVRQNIFDEYSFYPEYSTGDQTALHHLTAGEKTWELTFNGVTTQYTIIVNENPIISVAAEDVVVSKNIATTYTDSQWDEELEDWVDVEYTYYPISLLPRSITLTFSDGTDFTGSPKEAAEKIAEKYGSQIYYSSDYQSSYHPLKEGRNDWLLIFAGIEVQYVIIVRETSWLVEADGADSFIVPKGSTATLKVRVEAEDDAVLSYSWDRYSTWTEDDKIEYESFNNNSNTLVTAPVTKNNNYICRVSDQYGNWSDVAFSVDFERDDDHCGDDVTWAIEGSTLILSGSGDMWDYFGENGFMPPWYMERQSITKVIVEDGITGIGSYAFSEFSNLTEIELPEGITFIHSDAFANTVSLTEILLPSTVIFIGRYAFYGSGITELRLPGALTTIGEAAFMGCKDLSAITIESSLETVRTMAFHSCESLKTVYYNGTQDEWDAISIANYNTPLLTAELVLNGQEQEYGPYYFSTFAELQVLVEKDLVADPGDFSHWASLVYTGDGPLVITENITIPSIGKLMSNEPFELVVEEGATLTNEGAVIADEISIAGTVINNTSITCNDSLEISGELINNMQVGIGKSQAGVTGEITYATDNAWLRVFGNTADDLYEMVEECRENTNERARYQVTFDDTEVVLDKELTIPQGMYIYFQDTKVTIPRGVTVKHNGYITLNQKPWHEGITNIFEIVGSFINEGEFYLATAELNVTGTYCGAGFLWLRPSDVTLNGIDKDDFNVTEESGGQKWTGHHDYAVTASEPTCTEPGCTTYTCSRCGDSYTEEIPALGHSLVKMAAKDPACEEDGNTECWICERCEKHFDDAAGTAELEEDSWVIPAIGHEWEFTGFTWTGSDEEGYTAAEADYTCTHNANHTDTAEATITSQTTDATCEEAGNAVYTVVITPDASLDGEDHSETRTIAIPPLGHTEDEAVRENEIPATCTEPGSYEEVICCKVCKKELSRTTIMVPPLGHSLNKTEAKEPTCVEEGNAAYWTCSACGKYFEDEAGTAEIEEGSWIVPAIGHKYEETEWTWADDYSSATVTFTCETCGKTITEDVLVEVQPAEEVREAVQDLETEDLAAAMGEENSGAAELIAALEEQVQEGGTEVAVNNDSFDPEEVIVVGAALNEPEDPALPIGVEIGEAENEDLPIPDVYEEPAVVTFSLTLVNVEDPEELKVPVKVTLPCPSAIDSATLIIYHYHGDGEPEEVEYTSSVEDGKTYISFVLTSFSDFAFVSEAPPYPVLVLDEETTAVISSEGETAMFQFTPAKTGDYIFRSVSEEGLTTYGMLYDTDMTLLVSNVYGGSDGNFLFQCRLEANKTYYFGAKYYYDDTGSFPVILTEAPEILSVTASGRTLLEGNNGYWRTETIEDFENEQNIDVEYFYYYDIEPETITVTIKGEGSISGEPYEVAEEFYNRYDIWPNYYSDGQDGYSYLELGENSWRFTFFGKETTYTITVISDPIKSVTASPVSVYEGDGRTESYWSWDEETQQEIEVEYFRYYNIEPTTITVETTGGKFTGSPEKVEQDFEARYGVDIFCSATGQNPDHQLKLGANEWEYTFGGKTVKYTITVKENPIKSIVISPVTVLEGDGRWETDWVLNPETQQYEEKEYFYYYSYEPTHIIVTTKDGNTFEGYPYDSNVGPAFAKKYGMESHWEAAYQSYERQLSVGENTWEYNFFGKTVEYTINVVQNPIVSLEVPDVTVFEGEGRIDYSWRWDPETSNYVQEEFFCYDYNRIQPQTITVTTTDGESISGYPYEVAQRIQDLYDVYPQYYPASQSPEHLIELGLNSWTFTFGGVTVPYTITVIENPVESITVNDTVAYEGEDGEYLTSGGEKWFYYYGMISETITVKMKDGNEFSGEAWTVRSKIMSQYNGRFEFSTQYTDNQYEKHFKVGEKHEETVTFAGVSDTCMVTIKANPIKSVKAENIKVFANDNGSKVKTADGKEWFRYNCTVPASITVTASNGKTYKGSLGYVQNQLHDAYGVWFNLSCWFTANQSYENQFKAGKSYGAKVSVGGKEASYTISIVTNPITAVTNVANVQLHKNKNGETAVNDQGEEFFWYYSIEPSSITVKTKDKTFKGYPYQVAEQIRQKYGATPSWNCFYELQYENAIVLGNNKWPFAFGGVQATYTITVTETETNALRIYGKNRYQTGLAIADQLKELRGGSFDSVVVACGSNFPDALAGSYLATVKGAPILLIDDARADLVSSYIAENMTAGGTIYILGSTAAVSAKAESALSATGGEVKRLEGKNRYLTNIEILKEAGIPAGSNMLVCVGDNYADSLSASSSGLPILLVDKKGLRADQKEYLSTLEDCTFTIIGSEAAVSAAVEAELSAYSSEITRVAGKTRYETSIEVAKYVFGEPDSVVLTVGNNFPDGLSAGPLAYELGAPVVLTLDGKTAAAEAYAADLTIKNGIAVGGSNVLSNAAVMRIFGLVQAGEIAEYSRG